MTMQVGNSAGRDVIGGDKIDYNFYPSPSPLHVLYKKLRQSTDENGGSQTIIEELQHYCSKHDGDDVRGLELKLKESNRDDLLYDAEWMKQAASKMIMRWQTSGVAQNIITVILSKIYSDFVMHVRPAIQAGGTRAEVDSLIADKVIDPARIMLGDNDLNITPAILLGMLYFLAGNCHIRWDKC